MSSEMPDGWEEVSLSDCLEDFRNGWTYNTRAIDGTMPITRIETISNGEIDYGRIGFAQSDERIEAFRLLRNDILFSHINSVQHIAKVAIKVEDRPLFHGMNLMRLRPNAHVVPNFLFARLRSDETRDHFRATCKRAVNQASLNKGEIGSYQFPLPPLDEQRRIAEVLRSVDKVIAAQVLILETTRKTLSSVRHDVFTDPPLSVDFASVITLVSGQHVATDQCNKAGLGTPYLTGPSDFSDGMINVTKFTTSPSVMCQRADILITVKGSGVGKAVIADQSYCISRQLMAIRSHDVPTAFLFEALQMVVEELNAEASGPIPGITRDHILVKRIPKMALSSQESLADVFGSLRGQLKLVREQLDMLYSLKSSLMSDLLSGRVRVPA